MKFLLAPLDGRKLSLQYTCNGYRDTVSEMRRRCDDREPGHKGADRVPRPRGGHRRPLHRGGHVRGPGRICGGRARASPPGGALRDPPGCPSPARRRRRAGPSGRGHGDGSAGDAPCVAERGERRAADGASVHAGPQHGRVLRELFRTRGRGKDQRQGHDRQPPARRGDAAALLRLHRPHESATLGAASRNRVSRPLWTSARVSRLHGCDAGSAEFGLVCRPRTVDAVKQRIPQDRQKWAYPLLRDGGEMSRKTLRFVIAMAVAAGSLVGPAAPASAVPTCFGKAATIVGTNRDPGKPVELNGTPRNDVIVGLQGWDLIDGRGENDLICGGGGDDYIKAGAGNDKVRGEGGLDTISGQGGDDRIWGGGNTDGLLGGPGDDRLYGGRGIEDNFVGGPGNDFMDGGPGLDIAEFWDSPNGVEADLTTGTATGHGQDEIVSIEGLIGSIHDDILTGDGGPNMFVAERGNDEVNGLGGDDLLRGVAGENILDGGDGADTVSYNLTPVSVEADLALGEATTALEHDTLVGIEDLIGSKYDDILTGDDGDNRIVGNGGVDIIDGGAGVDRALFFDSRRPVTADLRAGNPRARR